MHAGGLPHDDPPVTVSTREDEAAPPHRPPRIVITNDDGIDAPGLAALYLAAEGLGERVVVAPDGPRSGAGHSVTTHEPVRVAAVREGWYSVGGTPADCSRIALTCIAPDAAWVLAGINRGGNLGADTYISGTVAAAREATFLGRRAIALSQYLRPDLEVDWEWTLRQSSIILRSLMAAPQRPSAFWNVNFPHLPPGSRTPEPVFCRLDICPLDVRFRVDRPLDDPGAHAHFTGNYHGRQRNPGRDVEVCFGGSIAITEIPLDLEG